jgi:uncharacterized protein YqjF (DUF2071 family)
MTATPRPWPAPKAPWVARMSWRELCFLHWRLDPTVLEPLLPVGLELDTFDGSAWIGVVPFRMEAKPRLLPLLTVMADFPEVNVRTYVSAGGKPGIWFFSLDADDSVVVHFNRLVLGLPYLDAEIEMCTDVDAVDFRSRRTHLGAGVAELRVHYGPAGVPEPAAPGSLEHFLAERYCLYTSRAGRIFRQEVDHDPWQLQPAKAAIELCTMTQPLGIELGPKPLAHFAAGLDVVAWLPGRV